MKRIITLVASLALVAGGLYMVPAVAAEEPPEIPEVANIEDPFGDANFLGGDQETPKDGGSLTDIGKVWFTHNETHFSAHVQTEGAPSATMVGVLFEVTAGDAGCLEFEGFAKGSTYPSDNLGRIIDGCNGIEREVVEFTFVPGPGGSGIATITAPRAYSPLFADGGAITAPEASSFVFVGGDQITPTGYRGAGRMVDDTKAGTDYVVTGGTPAEPAKPAKPAKPETPVKKGCNKGKGKKKGCTKTPPPKSCSTLEPATAGVDAPALTLTDEATADKPEVHTMTMEQKFDEGLAGKAKPTSVNVQVDTASNEPVGLYATLEFPPRRDYDLWAYFPGTDNKEAASAHGFQPLIDTKGLPDRADQSNTASNHGGESKADSENLVGILTPDCGGYTITAYTYLGEGGDLDLKLWLGEVKYDPASTGEEAAAARAYRSILSLF